MGQFCGHRGAPFVCWWVLEKEAAIPSPLLAGKGNPQTLAYES